MDNLNDAIRQLKASTFLIQMERIMGDKLEEELKKLATQIELKPVGNTIAAQIANFRNESGEDAFNAISQNPKLIEIVQLWAKERKLENGRTLVDAVLSIIPPENKHEIQREDAEAFLASQFK